MSAPRVPVTPKIQELFDQLPKTSEILFPDRSGKNPIVASTLGLSLSIALKQESLKGMQPFTAHDLRRTCTIYLGDLEFDNDEIKTVLDHSKSGDVTSSVYAKRFSGRY